MRLTYFGGPAWDAGPLPVRGRGQEALLFRLAIDAGTVVSYRALAEDVWPLDAPADPRAALQSLASRLRRALGSPSIDAVSGGYRLNLDRADIDLTRFADLVADARAHDSADAARQALRLWTGEPWVPEGFDWVRRDLLEDRAHAERLAASITAGSARTAGTPDPLTKTATAPRKADDSALPPASDPASSTSIPAPLTTLVGRADELAAIAAQLTSDRLVTLLGPGGAGKTTLALETARRTPNALFVELAPATAGEIWAVLAGAAGRGIRLGDSAARAQQTDHDRVIEALRGRSVLLVLDNCEHVSAAASAVAIEVLTTLPGVRILATSREPLSVPGEAFVDLGPLPMADAVELFSRRVRSARGSAPSPEDEPTVGRIVRRLDGLPLALELAAAKARTLSLAEIDAGLDDRFALLSTGPRAADPRHQTLRALIDWSWEPLPPDERAALLAASVFPDGIGAGDAHAVGAAFGIDGGAFDRLVDRSLLTRTDGRFRMLETVREYGIDRLRADGREHAARLSAAGVLATLAEAQEPLLRGPQVRTALSWFDANEESLGAAAQLACADPALRPLGIRLTRVIVWPSFIRERVDDLRRSAETFTLGPGVPDSEAETVLAAMRLMLPAFTSIDTDLTPVEVRAFARRTAEIAEGARRHPSDIALALSAVLSAAARNLIAHKGRAMRSWNVLVADHEVAGAPLWTRALVTVLRAASAQNNGAVDALGRESARALELFTEAGDPWGIALASRLRSEWLVMQGRIDEALAVSDDASAGLAGLTSVWDVIQQEGMALDVLARLGRFAEARERLERLRLMAEADGSARSLLQFHSAAATLAVSAGEPAEALAHLDAIAVTPRSGGEAQLRAWTASRRAQALLALGRGAEARESLRNALPLAFASGDHPIAADVVAAAALWLVDADRRDAARRVFAASVRLRGGADATNPMFQKLRAALGEPDPTQPLAPGRTTDEGDDDPEVIAALLD